MNEMFNSPCRFILLTIGVHTRQVDVQRHKNRCLLSNNKYDLSILTADVTILKGSAQN